MQTIDSTPIRNTNSVIPRCGRAVLIALTLSLGLIFGGPCLAQSADQGDAKDETSGWTVEQWYIFTSVYTKHWDEDPDHVNNQKMIAGEVQMKNNWVFGLGIFDNSFGQKSEYLYAGYKWDLFGSRLFYFKLTGGLLHGYKEPYEDKIPLNGLGVAPAILPVLGFQYKFFVTELNIAGTAAITITAGLAF